MGFYSLVEASVKVEMPSVLNRKKIALYPLVIVL